VRAFGFLCGMAALALGSASIAPPHGEAPGGLSPSPARKQKRGKGHNNRRGKGAISRAKRRPNRLTISKRVRRKHRRAA
jgi:hypothetical protein